MSALFFVIAAGIAIGSHYQRRPPAVACKDIGEVLPEYLRMPPEALVKMIPLSDSKGVVAVKYPEPRGLQVNPWDVAWYGLLQSIAFCHDHDHLRLLIIRAQRQWLSDHLVTRHTPDGKPFKVVTYDFPDPPWSSKPGWASALSQTAALVLLDRVRPPRPSERKMVGELARALTVPTKDGGIYTDFGKDEIVWQEVATPEKASDIINGHAAAVYIVAHELGRLTDFPSLQQRLKTMVGQGKRALLAMLPSIIPKEGMILYDYHGVGMRKKGHYSYYLIISVLQWMEKNDEVSDAEVKRIIDLRPYGNSPHSTRPASG